MSSSRVSFGLLWICLTAVGCGGGDRVAVYPVRGQVLFDGKPMAGGGSISFVPMAAQKGKTAGGTIEKDGTYKMSTYGDGDGAMAGQFRVVINQSVWDEPANDGNSDETPGAAPKPVETVPPEGRIPAIYSDLQNSPLTIEVLPGDVNEAEIKLERLQPVNNQQRGA
jgi:hypothetical protein